jgi:hypothetical protein
VADDRKASLQLVDLVGIGNLLEHLVIEDSISCEERDRILKRLSRENNFTDVNLSVLAGYGRSKVEVLARVAGKQNVNTTGTNQKSNDEYISLTEIVRAHSDSAPGYVVQSWLRSENTLAFLNLWEKENNPNYCEDAYEKLLLKKREASFTLTSKLWIEQTNAIGLVSKPGKSGGTFAHPMIACEFASWLTPEYKMLLLKLSLNREILKNDKR